MKLRILDADPLSLSYDDMIPTLWFYRCQIIAFSVKAVDTKAGEI